MSMPDLLLLDDTLDSLAENLALDEALLLAAEDGGPEVLRLWEWPTATLARRASEDADLGPFEDRLPGHAVVLGAGCKLADDVNLEACQTDRVPVSRRASGGGTVLLGPGCLLFSLVLNYDRDKHLADIHSSYRWILAQTAFALEPLGVTLTPQGTSDLALGERKVSGNAQQRKRTHLLHHGSLLYDFDAAAIERYLRLPDRQPAYRHHRPHRDFVTNLPGDAATLRRLLRAAWNATNPLRTLPHAHLARLLEEKYLRPDWTTRR